MNLLGLFGPKVDLILETDKNYYYLGEVVNVRIYVKANKSFKAEEIRLKFTCESRLYFDIEEEYYDDFSEQYEVNWRTGVSTIKSVDFKERIYDKGEIPAGSLSFERAIMIPPEAPPSCKGSRIETKWKIKAVIGRRLRRDIVSEKEITVMSYVFGEEYTTPRSFSFDFKDVNGTVTLPRIAFMPGEIVSGTLLIHANKHVKFSEIRIELENQEIVTQEAMMSAAIGTSLGNIRSLSGTHREVAFKGKISDKIEILDLREVQLPFTFQVPNVQKPSYQNPYYVVSWNLKIVFGRRLRRDFNINIPVIITNAISSQA